MSTPNSYPELPELPFERTSVNMADVIAYANSVRTFPTEVKRMAYCMFRNESANGEKGVNNNYGGIQADCGRWSGMKNAVGTTVRKDSGSKVRRFICFSPETGYKDTFNLLCLKCQNRGIFIGAADTPNITALVARYLEKWVGRTYTVPNIDEITNWTNLYNSASKLIR